MRIKFVQTYYYNVVPEWYDPLELDATIEGSREEQILDFELKRATKDGHYLHTMEMGEIVAEIVEDIRPSSMLHESENGRTSQEADNLSEQNDET